MTVQSFPGDLRIGVLNETIAGVENPAPSDVLPKLQLLVLLNGYQAFELGGREIVLDAEGPKAAAVIMLVSQAVTLRYVASKGAPLRKIALAAPHHWLDALPNERSSQIAGRAEQGWSGVAGRAHYHVWTPSSDICRLAGQIIAPPPSEDPRQSGLFRMSRGLEILRRALSDLQHDVVQDKPIEASRIAETLRLYIVENLQAELSLNEMERRLGRNRRSLQRLFKQEYGLTLSAFIRDTRLDLARRALQEQGVTVGQAAHLAHYTSAANFATAFRRQFGVAPHDLRGQSL